MRATFHGLEVARRAMFTQQSALHTMEHNIANQNTPGYSRQRVNFTQTEAYPVPAINQPGFPGQLGTGVQAGSIQRVRESFLDYQFRGENNKLGYHGAKANSLSKIEDIMNEPSESGLSHTMSLFWQSLHDVASDSSHDGAKTVALQRGKSVGETFTYLRNNLSKIQSDLDMELNVSEKNINSIIESIYHVNKQIASVEPHGALPNDLYDERDRLVDELSTFVNVEVTKVSNNGNSSAMAEGSYYVSMRGPDGEKINLVTGTKFEQLKIQKDASSGAVIGLDIGDKKIDFAKGFDMPQGRLKGLVESFGYIENGEHKGTYPDMIDDLDKMAYTFVQLFNAVHKEGYTSDGTAGGDFFVDLGTEHKGAASKVAVREGLKTKDLAVSTQADGKTGNGLHATNLANLQNALLTGKTISLEGLPDLSIDGLGLPIDNSIMGFFQGVIGDMAVKAQQAKTLAANSETLWLSVEKNRNSVSGVSRDEEFIDMIQFQHAYNAAARSITMVDEMLDKVINGMGIGGR